MFLCLILALPLPARAQSEEDSGRDLMAEALRLFMRGLMSEMQPALDDLSEFVEGLDRYHPPELLPNGDIIIRRKTDEEMEVGPEGEIEL